MKKKKGKRLLALAVAAAMFLSMGTGVWAADVSSSDLSAEPFVSQSDAVENGTPAYENAEEQTQNDSHSVSATQDMRHFTANTDKKAEEYTYEIVPLLAPFNEYFLVKTDNPDPESFRFKDKDSIYCNENDNVYYNDKSLIVLEDEYFADVVYENQETKRVKGGYIFYSHDTDGGEITLQTVSGYSYWGSPSYEDTDIKVTLPKLIDEADYLVNTYAKGDTFFEKMDAVQKGFNSICLYSGSNIRGEVYRDSPYWRLQTGHIDQSFYLVSPYSRRDSKGLFASSIYPFRYDSLGFPGMMGTVSKRLDSSSSYKWSSDYHWLIEVTYNGETRTYGGAGDIKGQGISEDKITRFFSFGENEKITLEASKQLLEAYAKTKMSDDTPQEDDQLTWSDICNTVGKEGAWVCIDGSPWHTYSNGYLDLSSISDGYSFLYQSNDRDSFSANSTGLGNSLYYGGSLGYASDAWVDGRYVSRYEKYVPGAKFEEHPESNIILLQTIIPVADYDDHWAYDYNTRCYRKVYENVAISESIGNLKYFYKKEQNTWRADAYAVFAELAELGLADEKYVDMLELTYDEVMALKVDRNTSIAPDQGYLYNGKVKPGTRFDRSAMNTSDSSKLSQLFASAKTLAQKNGLKFTLEKGYYGMCGESMYWVYLKDSKTLIITGTGDMLFLGENPWSSNHDMPLSQVIVGEGVASLEDKAFESCSEMKKIVLSASLKKIGEYAFYGCKSFSDIYYAGSEENWKKIEGKFRDDIRWIRIHYNIGAFPAEITAQPANVTAKVGDNVSFSVKAQGDGLTYQWYYKKAGQTAWTKWNGHTAATTTATANATWNGMQIYCKVTDLYGSSVDSNPAKMTVTQDLKITGQPQSQSVKLGNSLKLSVKAEGIGLSYQWYYKKAGQTAWTKWSGHTHATETATPNASWNGIQLYCAVKDSSGKTVNSTAAKITVIQDLKITGQPQSQSVRLGDSIQLSVKAEGTGLSYQWYFKKAGAAAWSKWNGRTKTTETVTPNASWNGIQLYCAVKDSSGKTVNSTAAKITVTQDLKITGQPQSQSVKLGNSLKLSVKAEGTGLSYQWYFKKAGAAAWSKWNGRTKATETVTPNASWNGIQLYCAVKDSSGKTVNSSAAKITVTQDLKITGQPQNQTVKRGNSLKLSVKAEGIGLSYQWYFKKKGQTAWSKWNGHTHATETVAPNTSWNGIQLYCAVKDSSGKTVNSRAATITVQ